MENNEIMEKVQSDDFAEGGVLSPEQFEDFFGDVQNQSEVLQSVNAVQVDASKGQMPRLNVDSRILQGVEETEAATLRDVNSPDVSYQTTKVALPWQMSHEAVNHTIGDAESATREYFVSQFSSDLEILASVGDESQDGFEGINDGWLTIAENRGSPTYSHSTSDGSGGSTPQPVDNDVFSELITTLDQKYTDANNQVFLASENTKQAYRDHLTDRSTGAGDAMLMSGEEPTPYGREILTPLGWPDDSVMLTSPDNLVYIVQSNMRMRVSRSGSDIVLHDLDGVYNLLAEVDFQILDEQGVAVANGIGE